MLPETVQALGRINRRFYRHHANAFDTSRRAPWPGWRTLLSLVKEGRDPGHRPLRVLDAGCGNGRFARYLASAWPGTLDYIGLDTSAELLTAAAECLQGEIPSATLHQADLLENESGKILEEAGYDLVVLFGVLHHVPGEKQRRALLQRLGRSLAEGGMLAVSVWRFDRDPRLAKKTVPWDELEGISVDPGDLEPGDHLLTWAGDRRYPRYCHLADEAEIARLVADLELPMPKRFADDGASGDRNHYLVFTRPKR